MRGLVRIGLLALLLAGAAAADERVMQSVGAAPLDPDSPGAMAPRNAAVAVAVADAARRVALDLLGSGPLPTPPPDTAPGTSPAPGIEPSSREELVDQALGDDPFAYATRFRILEDRGTRPALLSDNPEVQQEYVVLVEVHVDASRVAERLRAAGLLAPPAGAPDVRLRVVLESLPSFAAYDAVRRTLVDGAGAKSAVPLELERGHAVLAVESDGDPESLLAALQREKPPQLQVVPLSVEGDTLTLLVDWEATPPPAESADGFDTPERKRY